MEKIKLLEGWKFAKGCVSSLNILAMSGKKPDEIDLPHDAMILEERRKDTKNGSQTGFYPGGIYTYFKELHVPEDWKDKKIILEFEGVYETAMVYINGGLLATNLYGYSGFFVEIEEYLNFREVNEIKVIADNSSEENSRWYTGSGIYRDVNLYIGEKTYIPPEAVKISTENIEKGQAQIRVLTNAVVAAGEAGEYQAGFKVFYRGVSVLKENQSFLAGEGEQEIIQTLHIENPLLWDTQSPNLYSMEITLERDGEILDTAREQFGIRTIKADSKQGFLLNDKVMNLRGTCLHHDNGITGAATFEDAERRKLELVKSAGFNSIRSSHHPMSKAMLRLCDEMGLLVMDELFDMWTVHKNNKDFALHFLDEWEGITERMVNKDFNHPCVIMYSIGNEIPELGTLRGVEIGRKICEKLHSLDNGRYTTCGVNGLNAAGKRLFQIMKDVAPLIENKADSMAADSSQEGKSMGSNALNSIMEFMSGKAGDAFATHPKLTEAIAGISDATDIIGLNYMTGRHVLEAELHPDKTVVGTETFPADIFRLWTLVEKYPHIIGDFTWTGYDYLGEAGCGIFYYDGKKNFSSSYPDRLAYIGDITITGERRPISFYREIVYGLRHMPYIAVERVNRNGQKASFTPWMFKDNISSWTWKGYEHEMAHVDVYSDAQEVELFLNKKSMGKKGAGADNQYMAGFDVPYEAGELAVVDYVEGKERGKYSLKTAEGIKKIIARADKTVLRPNGEDLCYISVYLADENGIFNMQEEKEICVTVEGAGVLLGLGSGNPSNEEDYFSDRCTTFDGNALACIRAGHEPGKIDVKILAEGCDDISIKLEVKEC